MPSLNEDQKKVIKENKQVIEKRIHRSACFQRVFRGADGELALGEIDKLCGMRNDTFDPDPYVSAYNAGRRSVGIFIDNCINEDVEKAREMLKDAEKKTTN
ncbi:unnamed protein product [marine sediment metagenome]|uniref:Bbp19-like phage domain-containing protein n=1 Tax=marine sediment metagenome TaxID=412755 RepID=X1P3L0_9ZZZZ